MAGVMTPLSRQRPALAIPVPFLGLFLFLQVVDSIRSPLPIPTGDWAPILGLAVLTGLFWHSYVFATVADYDTDYLYIFKKTGREHIPLGSFYKLRLRRGYWYMQYRDEQARKKQVVILPLGINLFGFGNSDNSSIHGFIDAIWQHNPQLNVEYPWF